MAFELREAGLKYGIHVPDGEGPFTAILFLHGYGESGEDGAAQLRIGLPPVVVPGSPWHGFIVIAPQKPTFPDLWPTYREGLNEMLAACEEELGDRLGGRRVITGLSQGGHGTLNLARSLRWEFSSAAAICGWMDPAREPSSEHYREERFKAKVGEWADPALIQERLYGLPLWVFHGDEDEAVPVARSLDVAAALPETYVTIYEGVGHDSWTLAYDDPRLPGWFATT